MPKKVLILFAHPLYEKSRVHVAMVKAIPRIPEITFHDLYEMYPDFNINIRQEQQLLLEHDIIIWQHPMYWYSVPPMLKQWIDMVLEYGWAYGKGGIALQGKWIINAVSAGGPIEAYGREGRNRYTMREFLVPIEQTVKLCHMEYLPPFVLHGTHKVTYDEIRNHTKQYKQLLEYLVSGSANVDDFIGQTYMNDILSTTTNGR